LLTGSQTIAVAYSGDTNFLPSSGTITLSPAASIYVLNATASGALTLAGNANINVPGAIDVESNSSSAITGSGNAVVSAQSIQVVGGASVTGHAKFSPTPATAAPFVADPLAGLAVPSVSGSSLGAVNVSGSSSLTINPGIYSQITVSGSGTLTMNPGIYVIAGGGFTVSGNNSSVTGSGVLIYNAGTNYPNAGGNFGGINLTGNGKLTLSAPTTGVYAGLVIFQARDNAQPLTLSGNNVTGLKGSLYAPDAALTLSGNAHLNDALIVSTMNLSGNAIFNNFSLNAPQGAVAYSPAQLRTAYSVNNLALDGSGQTIAIIDAYDNPAIYQGLDQFDTQFGKTVSGPTLYDQYGPASSFLTVLNQDGQPIPLPATDPTGAGTANWESEEALDVEWTHALAPGAQLILVEANSQSLSDLMAAVVTAANQPGVSVVSMSWGFTEGQAVLQQDEAYYDHDFTTPAGHQPVTFLASTGDFGTANPEYPAFSPNVVAIGGTTLELNADNSHHSETGWGYYSSQVGAFIASGGGTSLYEPQPVYQQGAQSTGSRSTPDVSLVADPNTGAWIVDTYNLSADNPWEVVGGTSLSAPSWAGLIAVVNQGRVAAGLGTLSSSAGTMIQQALYTAPQSDFHRITSGTNGGYNATAGYNMVTGLGTPVADLLIPDLIAYQGTSEANVTVQPPANASGPSGADATTNVINVINVVIVANHDSGQLPLAPRADQGPAAPGAAIVPVAGVVLAPPTLAPLANRPDGVLPVGLGQGGTVAPVIPATLPVSADTFQPTLAANVGSQPSLEVWSVQPEANAPFGTQRDSASPRLQPPTPPAFGSLAYSAPPALGLNGNHLVGREFFQGNSEGALVGGDGDDLLIGGDGRDLLIGGFGADHSLDNSGADTVVAGTTAQDGYDQALETIMQEETGSSDTDAQDGDWLFVERN
jgi:hypothetical protein